MHSKTMALGAVAAMTLVLAALAFTLSFDALRQLTLEIGVRPELAWMAPVALDVAQAAAALALVALGTDDEFRGARLYCKALATGTVLLSVAGNGYHAFRLAGQRHAQAAAGVDVGYQPQPAAIAACIAMIVPLLFLALLHLFTTIVRALAVERGRYHEAVHDAHPTVHQDSPVTAPEVSEVHDPAEDAPVGDDVQYPGARVYAEASAVAAEPATVQPQGTGRHGEDASGEASVQAPSPLEAPPEQTLAPTSGGHRQTVDGLREFLAGCTLRSEEKEVAAILLDRPQLTYAQVAAELEDTPSPSTVCRRWQRFKNAAYAEGFEIPPVVLLPLDAITAREEQGVEEQNPRHPRVRRLVGRLGPS
uniref:Putative membrane protein n=1 Tax=Rhodococcus sp. B2 TaxID=1185468 RepID=A0A8A6W588_9NOCA|nr:putative membrane protein [Rhodococcus sp. B2]